MMKKLFLILFMILVGPARAQEKAIQWIGFEELDDSLAVKEKPVLIYFYTDWCAYCKKMDRHAFKDKEVIERLNSEFYAVKMNAESQEPIEFEGNIYRNPDAANKRNSIHEIPKLIASREQKLSFPTLLVLDKNFRVIRRSYEYLPTAKLKELIEN